MTITTEDVYFHHQIVATQDRVADSGLGFHENSHFVVFDRRGEAAGVVGLGVYPNVGIMFGYACFTVDGVQHNLRVSRALAGDHWTTRVGPLTYDFRKPLEEYELVLESNASGVAFRLLFTATALAGEVDNSHRPDQVQFNQFGSMTGRLEVDGRAFALEGWMAENCRWWARGAGSIPGLAAPPAKVPALAIWSPLDFGERKLWVEHNEYADGEVEVHDAEVIYGDGVRRMPLPALDHELAFDKESGLLAGGQVILRGPAGEALRVALGRPMAVLSLLGAGFSADERYRQGQYRGPSSIDHERWDFRTASPAGAQARFLDYFLEAECDGAKGYGTFELMRAG